MEVSGQLHAPTDLTPGKDYNTHWMEGWVGPWASVDAIEKKKFLLYSCRQSNLGRPALSLVSVQSEPSQLQQY